MILPTTQCIVDTAVPPHTCYLKKHRAPWPPSLNLQELLVVVLWQWQLGLEGERVGGGTRV